MLLGICTERHSQTANTAAASSPVQPSPSVLSFPPRLLRIFQTEGFKALFGGWVPRTVAISFGGAVFLGIYDFAANLGKPRLPEIHEDIR